MKPARSRAGPESRAATSRTCRGQLCRSAQLPQIQMEGLMTLERRALTRPLELRAAADDAPRKVGGYAVVYNSVTEIGDMFQEVFAPGAFTEAITGDVVALFGHD